MQYSGKENDNLISSIDENVMKLVKLIDEKYVASGEEFKPMDIGRKALYFTVDIVSTLAFGKSFGDLVTDSDNHQYIETIEESGPVIILVSVLPWISKLFKLPLLKSLLPSEDDTIGFGKIMGLVLSHIPMIQTDVEKFCQRNRRRKIRTEQEVAARHARIVPCARLNPGGSRIRDSRSTVRSAPPFSLPC
jgi:hypothetical protein